MIITASIFILILGVGFIMGFAFGVVAVKTGFLDDDNGPIRPT